MSLALVVRAQEFSSSIPDARYRLLDTKSIKMIDNTNDNTFTLDIMNYADLNINLKLIPQSEVYGKDWILKFTNVNASADLPLPYYFTSADTNKHIFAYFRIFNMQTTVMTISCQLIYYSKTFKNWINNLNLNLQTYYPYRSDMVANDLFAMIVSGTFLNNAQLPYNMPPDRSTNVFFDFTSMDDNLFIQPQTYAKAPFDHSYWSTYQVNTLLIPYVPYFSYCKGYGRYLYLYQLTENPQECSLKLSEDTIVVKEIPTSGIFPYADECDYSVQCQFEEDFTINSRGTRWWEGGNQILFYIYQDPISIDYFMGNRNDGESLTFDNMVSSVSDYLVKVPFIASG